MSKESEERLNKEQQMELNYLVGKLQQERKWINDAKDYILSAERKIAALVPGPEKGQKTITLENGTKITVERGFNYKADLYSLEEFWPDPSLSVPIKTKTSREFDATGYEWYRENNHKVFDIISRFVTVTPKKISVSVKVP